MANDSQRDKARAIFGKTFFENSKALPNPKNAAAALQKRANDRPIPTYKVGGAVKKPTPPQPTAAERAESKRFRDSIAKGKVTEAQGKILNRIGSPATREFKNGGKAEQDFTGLMKKAADRAAAKGTPVMKQGGATDAYTAKRVMSRIKAGNFKDGGRAESMRDRRMKDIEKDYKAALAKGKNEDVAKAKYEQRKADAADDYAKRTKADRTTTKAGEKAAEAALTEARRTKGESIKKRDMAADIGKFFAGKDMTPKAAEPAKAAAPAPAPAAKPKTRGEAFKAARKELGAGKTFTYEGKSYSTNIAGEGRTGTGKVRTGTGRTGTGTGRVVPPAAASAAATPPPPPPPPAAAAAPAAAAKPKSPINAGRSPGILSGVSFGSGKRTGYQGRGQISVQPKKTITGGTPLISGSDTNAVFTFGEAAAKKNVANKAKGGKVEKFAAGGAGKVRKGMMKGK